MTQPVSIGQVRQRLTNAQQQVLDLVWRRKRARREWPLTREIHLELGKPWVVQALDGLSGSIMIEVPEGDRHRYQLTLLGVVLTEDGPSCVLLLASYLRLVRRRFLRDAGVERIASDEVEAELELTPEDSAKLSNLIYVSGMWSGSVNVGPRPWEYGVPRDIDDLPEIDDVEHFVIETALCRFDPELPMRHRDRIRTLVARDQGRRSHQSVLGTLVQTASHELNAIRLAGAASRLEEALEDVVRRPRPDPSGATDHAMAALESVMRELTGDENTLGQLLKRHAAGFGLREPLGKAMEFLWGFASEMARHGKEGQAISLAEAEAAVGITATIIRLLIANEGAVAENQLSKKSGGGRARGSGDACCRG